MKNDAYANIPGHFILPHVPILRDLILSAPCSDNYRSDEWVKISTLQFEVAVRVRFNLGTLSLIQNPKSAVFLGGLRIWKRIESLGFHI